MDKLKKYIPRVILLDTALLAALYAASELILRCFGLMFRQRVFWIVAALTALGLIAGTVQLLLRIKKKAVRITLIVLFAALALIACNSAFLLAAFAYEQEYVVEKDGVKYTAYVYSFMDTTVRYYDYKGPLVTGKQIRIKEYYRTAVVYDPFGSSYYANVETTYYDDGGNVVKVTD